LRDCAFYLLSVGLFFAFVQSGSIPLWGSCLFLVTYVVYVMVVFIGRSIHRRNKAKRAASRPETDRTMDWTYTTLEDTGRDPDLVVAVGEEREEGELEREIREKREKAQLQKKLKENQQQQQQQQQQERAKRNASSSSAAAAQRVSFGPVATLNGDAFGPLQVPLIDDFFSGSAADVRALGLPEIDDIVSEQGSSDDGDDDDESLEFVRGRSGVKMAVGRSSVNSSFSESNPAELRALMTSLRKRAMLRKAMTAMAWGEWSELGVFGKIAVVLEAPFTLLRNLTIPRVEEATWSRWLTVACPPLGLVFCLFAFDKLTLLSALVAGSVGLLLSIAVMATTVNSRPPKWAPVLALGAFVSSVVWIYLLANELVNVLSAFGVVLGVSDEFLSLTVLSIGNSVGDLVADVVLSKSGFPGMAIGGVYGSPVLNILLGLGLSTLVVNLKSYPAPLAVSVTPIIKITFLFVAVVVVTAVALTAYAKFTLRKSMAIALSLIYTAYFACATYFEVKGHKK
jgi:sodium/potassium/calcium exchanger 6